MNTMKKIIALVLLLSIVEAANAQRKLLENFDHPVGDSLGAHGWVSFSGGATNRLLFTAGTLSLPGYTYDGIGNSGSVTTTGQDAYVNFSSPYDTSNAVNVYASFLVNISSAQVGDYFIAFLPSTSTTFFTARVFVRNIGNGLNFALAKSSPQDTTIANFWSPNVYSLNTTYLLVIKYTLVPGSANDQLSLFVLTTAPATEPSSPTIGPLTFASGDPFNLGRIALRQGTSTRAPNAVIDGINVTTSWLPFNVNAKIGVQGIFDSNNNRHVRRDTASVYLRNSTAPYAIVDSAWSVLDSLDLSGDFEFTNAASGNYYLDVRFRKSPVFRNGLETWSRSGGEAFSRVSYYTYDFTSAASQAYGSNQIQVGSRYLTYNGDVNQDGTIDITDLAVIDNDVTAFASGYLATDVNGDEFTDIGDIAITDNNASNFVGKITP